MANVGYTLHNCNDYVLLYCCLGAVTHVCEMYKNFFAWKQNVSDDNDLF